MNTARRKGDSVVSGRKGGRPPKTAQIVPYAEVDRLLVFGECVPTSDGHGTALVFPSYRDLALRYGVSNSVIAVYAKKHNCLKRRAVAQARIEAKADEKLVELRAEELSLSRDDELRIIDSYLAGFEKSLADGTIRFDDPAHFDRFCRLKEFLLGGADSRQEVHAALSLEDLQAKHRQMIRQVEESSAAERRGAEPLLPAPASSALPASGSHAPAIPAAVDPEEATGRFPRGVFGPSGAPNDGWGDGQRGPATAPRGANVGPTRGFVGPADRATTSSCGGPPEPEDAP